MRSEGNRKWDYGYYYFPIFDIPEGLVIQDLDEGANVYVSVWEHSLTFEALLTREDVVRRVVQGLTALLDANENELSLHHLQHVVDGGRPWGVRDMLNEGMVGANIPTFVQDEGVLYDAIHEVYINRF